MALDTKVGIIAAAEDIFGQYVYSVGAGAGRQWVRRCAIRALREYYFDTIVTAVRKHPGKWKHDAPYILSFMRAIGALAANLALAEGLHTIGDEEMMQAVRQVEHNYNKPEPQPGLAVEPVRMGAWCPEGGG